MTSSFRGANAPHFAEPTPRMVFAEPTLRMVFAEPTLRTSRSQRSAF
jgi:hypothetical protein